MRTKEMTRIAIFAAITACLSQLQIPLPFTPIPVSLGTLAVMLTGAILTPKEAFLAELIYVLLGTIGIPIFHGFQGGIGILLGPTGGYLFAYPLMAWLIAAILTKMPEEKKLQTIALLSSMILGNLICYILGCSWFMLLNHITFGQAFLLTGAPFIIGDCLKILIVLFISPPIRAQIQR